MTQKIALPQDPIVTSNLVKKPMQNAGDDNPWCKFTMTESNIRPSNTNAHCANAIKSRSKQVKRPFINRFTPA
jgi:hypothetical protein